MGGTRGLGASVPVDVKITAVVRAASAYKRGVQSGRRSVKATVGCGRRR
ncbi:MAG: hypothetical protein LBK73_00210 [Treponema sp.]|nr:hypothetical protein [Treponema sp.]